MTSSKCPAKAFVVVTSGAEAKFFINDGTPHDLKLKHAGSLTPQNLDDDGPSGNRPPESSNQETDEATFSKQLAQHLYTKAHKGDFEHLVLVADPDTLGEIRPILHQEVTQKITLELAKTLINSPTEDIERSISAG